jgi:N-acetyl sugar amidotransferase
VSGGKDSHWQVIKCLEYGLNPLCVTWKTPARTGIGVRNLANLVRLGIDHIDYQINPKVEKKFIYGALDRYGDPAIPMHMALFNIPLNIAVKFGIPLVVWGENSAFEYGSLEEEHTGFKLDAEWLSTYGVLHGTTAQDWVSKELTEKELTPYFGPSQDELEIQGVLAVFLGYYFPWDPEKTLQVARKHGFQVREEGPKTGYYDYADIDDEFISIHHYLKWYKFGFTRTFDNLSLEIRNGRISRDEAIEILRERGDELPHDDIAKFCDYLSISREHFFELIEKFRNPNIWIKKDGKWMVQNFLIPDWNWT